ncbi:MAG: pullulanase [Ignavibacteriae bacterium HGW-Ignavibacteriae-2]|jgi:pullulanase/glycogen debranching enzyme|nr:pullulanase [Bacteroidota bacterium]PKL89774.1 MAG: pullulanase [Ignavibacteriae bacterium HGW-Ignavibacteriae-2]
MKQLKLFSIIIFSAALLVINNIKGENLFIYDNHPDIIVDQEILSRINRENIDEIISDKKLGSFVKNDSTTFRIFAPNAANVTLFIFDKVTDETGVHYTLTNDKLGVWEIQLPNDYTGKYYGFKIKSKVEEKLEDLPLCVDPYAKAVASYTTYNNPRKSIVYSDNYDWQGDTWIQRDWRDLIIYEMHIRDMSADPTSGASQPGTYGGLIEDGITGGINYIEKLGVNTVELMPAMEFANCEIPYLDSLNGKYNTWNYYERNHWGYMTSSFFAPSSYYSMNWNEFKWNQWMGTEGKQVTDFKDMVKAFHKKGIAVIMDVVYNHLSEYEIGNLKQIDREYYFRLDDKSNFIAESGCGNDLKTERPMLRRLITESILYWMKEYHVDGFRFDLGKLLDWETIEEVIREARKLNPNVVFVCEPWGGGYDPEGFSLREWGSWNDQIRNGIKGENPKDGLGWIFGKWYGNNNINRIKSYVNGTLVNYEHGLFQKKEHSVNYLESHDGYTLGDFIRIGSGEVNSQSVIKDTYKNAVLSDNQLRLNKLGALFLFTSQGITMIHAGQEFARSKVIPFDGNVNDIHKGQIDHNSYEKDNTTNYINFKHAEINKDLFNYYKGLIELRKSFAAFREADPENIIFFETAGNPFALSYQINFGKDTFLVLLNASNNINQKFICPEGKWNVLVDENTAGVSVIKSLSGEIVINSKCGMVLKKQ